MEQVFKRWEYAKKDSSPLGSLEGGLLFGFLVSEYYNQNEEENTGVTELNCCKLYRLLGMTEEDLNNPFVDEIEGCYDNLSTDILNELDLYGVIFFLLEPSVTKPYYIISLSPIIKGLIESTGIKLK